MREAFFVKASLICFRLHVLNRTQRRRRVERRGVEWSWSEARGSQEEEGGGRVLLRIWSLKRMSDTFTKE
jgi:hypothetical protein